MRTSPNNNAGFSLIEMVVVIVVLGILAAVAMQSMTTSVDDIRRTQTERKLDLLAKAIVGNPEIYSGGARGDFGYVGDIGAFPPNLSALIQNPGGFSTWDGPYLPLDFAQDSSGFDLDAWGKAYVYDGSLTITSVGGSDNLIEEIPGSTTDYLLNVLTGDVKDAVDSVPGVIYSDSVDIIISIPDGAGGISTRWRRPDSSGAFVVDSLPVGTHPLRVIYAPAADTLLRYVTILPRHKNYPPTAFRFAMAYFSSAGPDCTQPDTLRPSAPGTVNELVATNCPANWQCVDESTSDGDDTYVESSGTVSHADLYRIAVPADTSCTITSVTVHVLARQRIKTAYAKAVLQTYATTYEGPEETLSDTYVDYNVQWTSNPFTGSAWTWSEVAALQIGVSLRSTKATHPARGTQVWTVVTSAP